MSNEETEKVEETESAEELVNESDKKDDPEELTAEDIRNMQEALKKANHEAAKYRHERNDYKEELQSVKEKLETDEEKREREIREQTEQEVRESVESKYRRRLVQAEAKAALRAAGVSGKTDKLVRLIDDSAVEIDDDGNVTGLDEQIESLEEDFPQLFGGASVGDADIGDRKPSEKKTSSAAALADALN